jgi:ADP-ribose pyrophosphatase YjhB (NUDIX family)
LYAAVVRNTVVCCVDILLVRTTGTGYKEALLVERSSEPAKGLWWLPGGRLLKGETFFQAALRKARQETGLAPHVLRAIQIIGVYNTFFPTSAWDTPEAKGTQTVNPIVLVELLSTTTADAKIQLDAQSERYRWISLAPTDNTTEDKYVQQALLRLHAWNPHYSRTASS